MTSGHRGWLTYAGLYLLLLCGVAAVPSRVDPEAVESHAVKLDRSKAGADLLVEAMRERSRPTMSEEDAARFEAVLAAARGKKREAVAEAWKAFADAYFDDETRKHQAALRLTVLAAATEAHAPTLAKPARAAARSKQRLEQLGRRAAALEKAIAKARVDNQRLPREERSEVTIERLERELAAVEAQQTSMSQSFNMQYLLLQQKMQQDNRQFTLLSNIMKTKHDTAKAAINNVR